MLTSLIPVAEENLQIKNYSMFSSQIKLIYPRIKFSKYYSIFLGKEMEKSKLKNLFYQDDHDLNYDKKLNKSDYRGFMEEEVEDDLLERSKESNPTDQDRKDLQKLRNKCPEILLILWCGIRFAGIPFYCHYSKAKNKSMCIFSVFANKLQITDLIAN